MQEKWRKGKVGKRGGKWTGRDIATKSIENHVCDSFWPFHSRPTRPAMRKIKLCAPKGETLADTDPKISHVTPTADTLTTRRGISFFIRRGRNIRSEVSTITWKHVEGTNREVGNFPTCASESIFQGIEGEQKERVRNF